MEKFYILLFIFATLSLETQARATKVKGVFKALKPTSVPKLDLDKLQAQKAELARQIDFFQSAFPDSPGRKKSIEERIAKIDMIQKQIAAAKK